MKSMSRLLTASAAAAFAAAALLIPTTAHAAPAAPVLTEDTTSSTCTVTGGTLSWGVKEGFRSYISGSIANGSWEVADGATYETPLFGWSNPSGSIDATTGEGSVSFTGSVHFSGHDGVLNLLIANPTIVLGGDGTAQLLLDTKSNNAQGELVVDEQQAYIGKIEKVGAADLSSGVFSLANAPAVLTADGAAAFGGFYASGDELDPLTMSLQLGPCEGTAGVPTPPETSDKVEAVANDPGAAKTGIPWLPIAIGGVALVVIGVTAGMLIAGRKKGTVPAAAAENSDLSEE